MNRFVLPIVVSREKSSSPERLLSGSQFRIAIMRRSIVGETLPLRAASSAC
jgi:hypothetical protein